MTENEALEMIKSMTIHPNCEMLKAFEFQSIVIKALEDLEQYRAIGTVEELKSMKENGAFTGVELAQLATMQMRLKEYSAIGTIEEIKALKEKNVAKKPRFYAHNYYCTECGNLVGNNEFEWQRFLYCDKCGQKLDWE